MAASERSTIEPVPGFRYAVEIDGIVDGWFTECGGLSIERSVYPHQEGGLNAYVHQLPGPIQRARITLQRGLAGPVLWDWFTGQKEEGLYLAHVERRNVTIILYGADRSEAWRWNLGPVFPSKWTGPDLRSGDNVVAVEALEIAQGESLGSSGVQRAPEADAGDSIPGPPQAQAGAHEIDLPALARRVYAFLQAEARIERERLGTRRPR